MFQQGCFLYLAFPVGFQLLITFIFCQFCFVCVTFVVFVSIASYFRVLTGLLCIPNISCWCSVANYICARPVLLVWSRGYIVCVAFCLRIAVASCFCVLTRVMVFCVVKLCLCTLKGDGILCCENVQLSRHFVLHVFAWHFLEWHFVVWCFVESTVHLSQWVFVSFWMQHGTVIWIIIQWRSKILLKAKEISVD